MMNIFGRSFHNGARQAAAGRSAPASETDAGSSALDRVNRATAIMLAAANLDTDWLEKEFLKREDQPFRAEPKEFGLDIGLIRQEVRYARAATRKMDTLVLALSIVWLGLGISALGQTAPGDTASMGLAAVLFAATALLIFVDGRRSKERVRRLFAMSGDDLPCAAPASGDLTVSGGFSPFAGSGVEMTGWAFTVNILKPEHEGKPVEAVAVRDLYRETEAAVRELQLPLLRIKDEFFADGRDAQHIPALLTGAFPSKPRASLPGAVAASCMECCNTTVRHYKAFRLELWGGQLVLSVFVKYVKLAASLFVETRVFVLPPLAPRLSSREDMTRRGRLEDLRYDLVYSTAMAMIAWMHILLRAARFVGRRLEISSKEARSRKAILRTGSYNFGWPSSHREDWSARKYERYFQQVDNDLYTKMLKEALLDSLIASLEKRNVCTAGLTEATTKIFNEGIILTGGSVHAGNLAVGKQATAASNETSDGANRWAVELRKEKT